jgi:hypothetical protein
VPGARAHNQHPRHEAQRRARQRHRRRAPPAAASGSAGPTGGGRPHRAGRRVGSAGRGGRRRLRTDRGRRVLHRGGRARPGGERGADRRGRVRACHRRPTALGVPDGVQLVVRRRIDRLSEDAHACSPRPPGPGGSSRSSS